MELAQMPRGESGPGMCGCDRDVFQRVWRRVMPEDRYDSPVQLLEDGPLPPQTQRREPAADSAPWPLEETTRAQPVRSAPNMEQSQVSPPPNCPQRPESHCVCANGAVKCLGESSAIYGAELQRFIDGELADARTYTALARWGRGTPASRQLASIAADEQRHAKRLSTAYFLISGVRYWPETRGSTRLNGAFPLMLRTQFCGEQRGEAAYLAAAATTADPCLKELYIELAGDENTHAWMLRTMLERL